MTLVLKVDCRACNRECGDYKHLLDETVIDDESTTLAALLNYCTTLECFGENHENGMPEHICNSCVEHLLQSYLFKEMVLQNDRSYRERLQVETQSKQTKLEMVDAVIEEEQIVEQEIDVGGVEENVENPEELVSETEEINESTNMEAEYEYEEWLEIDDCDSEATKREDTTSTNCIENEGNINVILVKNEADEDNGEYILSTLNDSDADEELKGFDNSKEIEEKDENMEIEELEDNTKAKEVKKIVKRKSLKVS